MEEKTIEQRAWSIVITNKEDSSPMVTKSEECKLQARLNRQFMNE